MKNELTISKLIINRFNQLAKPANLKERKEKEDLASLTYCEIDQFEGNEISASVCFNDNDYLWFYYKVDFLDVVNHLFDVRNGKALIEYDIEGNVKQWVDVYDVEIDNYDVLTYLIANNMLGDYYKVTNEMGEVLDVVA